MIFISSSCVKSSTIKDSVLALALEGFKNIELSGGTEYYDGYLQDIFELRKKYSLNYLVHNYFPPPKKHFMLNLASLNDERYKQSIEQCKQAISICKKMDIKKYGVHAGFLIDFLPSEAGKNIELRDVGDLTKSLQRFGDAWMELKETAGENVELYVENNVFSKSNLDTYKTSNPFLLTDYSSWLDFSERIDSELLLDLAHLKVSSKSLGLSFSDQVDKMISLTDYYHISGNDSLHDKNHSILSDQEMIKILEKYQWNNKTITLEIYNDMKGLHKSHELITDYCC